MLDRPVPAKTRPVPGQGLYQPSSSRLAEVQIRAGPTRPPVPILPPPLKLPPKYLHIPLKLQPKYLHIQSHPPQKKPAAHTSSPSAIKTVIHRNPSSVSQFVGQSRLAFNKLRAAPVAKNSSSGFRRTRSTCYIGVSHQGLVGRSGHGF